MTNNDEIIRRMRENLRTGKDRVPAGAFYHGVPREILVAELIKHLEKSGRYIGLRERKEEEGDEEGGTRITLVGIWTVLGRKAKEIIVKADRADREIVSEQGLVNVRKGYNTENDLESLLSIPNPGAHHLARVADGDAIVINGEKIYFLVEEAVDGKSLDKRVKENGPISPWEFQQVFSGVVDAAGYLIQRAGRYHRDLKPSNIIVSEKGTVPRDKTIKRPVEATVTDLANSCLVGESEVKAMPTGGGRKVTNPFQFKKFAGKEGRYDESSEIYSIGASMYYALTGKHIFDFEYFDGREKLNAEIAGKIENLLNKDGTVNKKKFKRAIDAKLDPTFFGTTGRIAKKCLLAPIASEQPRFSFCRGYKSLDEVAKDVKEMFSAERGFRQILLMGAIALPILAGLCGVAYKVSENDKATKAAQEMAGISGEAHGVVNSLEKELDETETLMMKFENTISDKLPGYYETFLSGRTKLNSEDIDTMKKASLFIVDAFEKNADNSMAYEAIKKLNSRNEDLELRCLGEDMKKAIDGAHKIRELVQKSALDTREEYEPIAIEALKFLRARHSMYTSYYLLPKEKKYAFLEAIKNASYLKEKEKLDKE
jgi:serine/threonine protein kinase